MAKKFTKDYKSGEHVNYPSHGVGEIVGLEEIEIGGANIEMMVIKFDSERMTLRLPLDQLEESGLRHIASSTRMDTALNILKGKSRNKTTMWARRAQEYESKINSGDIESVAEVLRDLFRGDEQPEQSYSERQLYQSALERLSDELAIIRKMDCGIASRQVEEILGKDSDGDPVEDAEMVSHKKITTT